MLKDPNMYTEMYLISTHKRLVGGRSAQEETETEKSSFLDCHTQKERRTKALNFLWLYAEAHISAVFGLVTAVVLKSV